MFGLCTRYGSGDRIFETNCYPALTLCRFWSRPLLTRVNYKKKQALTALLKKCIDVAAWYVWFVRNKRIARAHLSSALERRLQRKVRAPPHGFCCELRASAGVCVEGQGNAGVWGELLLRVCSVAFQAACLPFSRHRYQARHEDCLRPLQGCCYTLRRTLLRWRRDPFLSTLSGPVPRLFLDGRKPGRK